MYRLFLASRYTLARPVSYLAMVAIGLAVMALIVVVSIMNGFLDETRAFLRGTTADIVVFPLQSVEAPYPRERVEALVRGHPDVVGVASRLVRPAVFKVYGREPLLLSSSRDASATQVLVHGIDPEQEFSNTRFGEYLRDVEERALRVEDLESPFALPLKAILRDLRTADHPRVLMGEVLLNSLSLSRGDGIVLVTVPDGVQLDGEAVRPTSQTFVIAGAFNTGHYNHDKGNVYVPRDQFGPWAGTAQQVSELYVTCRADVDLSFVKADLDQALRSESLRSIVETWEDRHHIWLGAVKNERNILLVIFLFFLLLVCTITYSVLTMMVQQKTRDVGILSSMGAPAGGIGSIFGLCGLTISTLGGILGLFLGTFLARQINAVKDFVEWLLGIEVFSKEVYAFTDIPVTLHHDLNLAIAAVTVVGAALICIMPAVRAARLDPVEALRHE